MGFVENHGLKAFQSCYTLPTRLSSNDSAYNGKPICFIHSLTSSTDHVGTCWLSLWGTSSPNKRSVWAAYLEAMPLGPLATLRKDSTQPISCNSSGLPYKYKNVYTKPNPLIDKKVLRKIFLKVLMMRSPAVEPRPKYLRGSRAGLPFIYLWRTLPDKTLSTAFRMIW